jgi:hypothetical protein
MKYKVILALDGSGETGAASVSFYTKSQAQASATQWREQGAGYLAYLWDGSAWTLYAPIP